MRHFGLEFKRPHTSLLEDPVQFIPVLPLVYPVAHSSGIRENEEHALLASEGTPTRKLTGEGQPGLGGESKTMRPTAQKPYVLTERGALHRSQGMLTHKCSCMNMRVHKHILKCCAI